MPRSNTKASPRWCIILKYPGAGRSSNDAGIGRLCRSQAPGPANWRNGCKRICVEGGHPKLSRQNPRVGELLAEWVAVPAENAVGTAVYIGRGRGYHVLREEMLLQHIRASKALGRHQRHSWRRFDVAVGWAVESVLVYLVLYIASSSISLRKMLSASDLCSPHCESGRSDWFGEL